VVPIFAVEVPTKENNVDNVRYCDKKSVGDKGGPPSKCFLHGITGIPR